MLYIQNFKSYCYVSYKYSSMWFGSIVTSMKNLYIALNKGLRRILNLSKYNSASEMFVNQNMPSSMSCYEKLCVVLVVESKTLVTR